MESRLEVIYKGVSYNNKITVEDAEKLGKQIDIGTLAMAKMWSVSYLEAKYRIEMNKNAQNNG